VRPCSYLKKKKKSCITKINGFLAMCFVEFFRLSLPLVSGERKAGQIIISANFST
jgi:hypothetical protein